MFAFVVAALLIGSALPYAELIGKVTATTPLPSSSDSSDDPLEFGDEPF